MTSLLKNTVEQSKSAEWHVRGEQWLTDLDTMHKPDFVTYIPLQRPSMEVRKALREYWISQQVGNPAIVADEAADGEGHQDSEHALVRDENPLTRSENRALHLQPIAPTVPSQSVGRAPNSTRMEPTKPYKPAKGDPESLHDALNFFFDTTRKCRYVGDMPTIQDFKRELLESAILLIAFGEFAGNAMRLLDSALQAIEAGLTENGPEPAQQLSETMAKLRAAHTIATQAVDDYVASTFKNIQNEVASFDATKAKTSIQIKQKIAKRAARGLYSIAATGMIAVVASGLHHHQIPYTAIGIDA